ncbi:hypothetical protein AOLI_G00135750 [Acnodon oligacanthus]
MVHYNGIPDEQVVVMMYDDIAFHEENPYPGEVINEPNGPNVYPGVLKDYTGDELSKVLISNFLGYSDSRTHAERASQAENFKVTHLTPSHEVPLIIQQKRIQREMDPEKKRALQRDYDKLLQKINRTEKALQDIAKHACPDRDPPAGADRRPLTRLDNMKDVVEHFRRTFCEWYKEQDDAFVLSHLHVFVNLLESGVGVARERGYFQTLCKLLHLPPVHGSLVPVELLLRFKLYPGKGTEGRIVFKRGPARILHTEKVKAKSFCISYSRAFNETAVQKSCLSSRMLFSVHCCITENALKQA